jgi:hypothetical protein
MHTGSTKVSRACIAFQAPISPRCVLAGPRRYAANHWSLHVAMEHAQGALPRCGAGGLLGAARLVGVCDEEHAVVGGGHLERVRLVQDVLRALDRQAPIHLQQQETGSFPALKLKVITIASRCNPPGLLSAGACRACMLTCVISHRSSPGLLSAGACKACMPMPSLLRQSVHAPSAGSSRCWISCAARPHLNDTTRDGVLQRRQWIPQPQD